MSKKTLHLVAALAACTMHMSPAFVPAAHAAPSDPVCLQPEWSLGQVLAGCFGRPDVSTSGGSTPSSPAVKPAPPSGEDPVDEGDGEDDGCEDDTECGGEDGGGEGDGEDDGGADDGADDGDTGDDSDTGTEDGDDTGNDTGDGDGEDAGETVSES